MPDGVALVADVGGTNTRLSLATVAPSGAVQLSQETVVPTREIERLGDVFWKYLHEEGQPELAGCAVCAAGPPAPGDEAAIRLTNAPLRITLAELREASGAPACRLMNDFSALALALPALQEADVHHLGGPARAGTGPRAVLGPGTGLGVSGLLAAGDREAVVEGEGGHCDLAPCTPAEDDLVRRLRLQGGHVSAERVLSGPGLERLYLVMAQVLGADPVRRPAAEIAQRAFDATDDIARETVSVFTLWLGRVAGNLALTLGARGGVYLGGGIVQAWGDRFDARRFREGFEDKGSFRAYLEAIPAWRIVHPRPALLGLARSVLATDG